MEKPKNENPPFETPVDPLFDPDDRFARETAWLGIKQEEVTRTPIGSDRFERPILPEDYDPLEVDWSDGEGRKPVI